MSANAFAPTRRVAEIRAKLDHPIIDGDGHLIEFLPLLREFLLDVAGPEVLSRYDALRSGPREGGRVGPYWTLPSKNTLDRATPMLPELLVQRMDQFGLDFALLYPSFGMMAMGQPDENLRRGFARAANTYYAEVFAGHGRRVAPVAVIPTFTPEEAVDELEHAVGRLGLKAVVMGGIIPRTRNGPDGKPQAWLDTLGHDSEYDYDPVWRKCLELGVAPTFHSVGFGHGTRMSRSNYVYNHIGHFGWAQEGVCRSLVLGGVPKRFPGLRFGFLEGGAAWGCQLYADLVGHFEKRNVEAMSTYDPDALDRDLYEELFARYARGRMAGLRSAVRDSVPPLASRPTRAELDDFAQSGIRSRDDIAGIFRTQFFFGCEADDPMNALPFDRRLLPGGIRANAMFASDIGHWDVPDMTEVLPEAWELVEHGLLDSDAFRAFTAGNAARLLTGANPGFFTGTVIEPSVGKLTGA